MVIAVQYEKINLGNDRFFFKPLCIINGEYDENSNVFETEHGVECYPINGSNIYADNYFAGMISMDELREKSNKNMSDNEIIQDYFDFYMDQCYLGHFNMLTGFIDVVYFDFYEFEQRTEEGQISEEVTDTPQVLPTSTGTNIRFTFDLSELKNLRDNSSLEDFRSKLDEIINKTEQVQQQILTEIDENKKLILKSEESKKFNLKALQGEVLKKIISQEAAVKKVTTAIAKNYTASNSKNKSHILIAGPTGTGKTEMVKIICNYLKIPFYKVDATDFTQEGYVGRSVNEMLSGLINACGYNIEQAQKGILVIDEIDKKASSKDSRESVATKAVLDSLLKITGRGIVQVDVVYNGAKQTIDFDTSNLTVIFMGAFAGIEEKEVNKTVGFIKNDNVKENKKLTTEDFVKYGMTPELLGRIECIAPTKPFEVEDYVELIYKSKISPLLYAKDYFENDMGIRFTYTSNYVKEIAKQAKEINLGARGVKRAIDNSLIDLTDKVLNGEKIKMIKLTKETALDNKKYYIE